MTPRLNRQAKRERRSERAKASRTIKNRKRAKVWIHDAQLCVATIFHSSYLSHLSTQPRWLAPTRAAIKASFTERVSDVSSVHLQALYENKAQSFSLRFESHEQTAFHERWNFTLIMTNENKIYWKQHCLRSWYYGQRCGWCFEAAARFWAAASVSITARRLCRPASLHGGSGTVEKRKRGLWGEGVFKEV